MRPPTVPQFAHIILCRLFVDREVRRFQKTGDTEKDRFSIFQVLAQSLQREPLRNERKRQLVLFITEGGRDFLKERFVSSVIVDLGADAGGFFLQTKLGGGIEHAPDAIFRQVSERRLATPRPSERNVGAERLRQNRRIDPDLRDVAIRFGAREKLAVAFIDKNVKDRFFERGIDGVTMQIPVPIDQIDFDAAAQRFAAIHPNRGVAKIGSGFAVPDAKLDNVDLVAGRADEILPKLAGEPACLEL